MKNKRFVRPERCFIKPDYKLHQVKPLLQSICCSETVFSFKFLFAAAALWAKLRTALDSKSNLADLHTGLHF